MVYVGRYRLGFTGPRMLPGGRVALALVFVAALAILGLEVVQELGLAK